MTEGTPEPRTGGQAEQRTALNPIGQHTDGHGQPALRLQLGCGDSALIALHGAQVLSWVAAGRERLYLSPNAVFDGQAAIRGGIPLCFPQFNQRGPLPKHGFARNLPWQPLQVQADQVLLQLVDDAQTRRLWPHGFTAQLQVQLAPGRLHVELRVHNSGSAALEFTAALHSYLRVADIAAARLQGLDGCARWDAVRDVHGVQQGDITFDGEYDSVLQAAAGPLQLHDGAERLHLAQSPLWGQTVVWNPGAALCARLPDMPPAGYREMLCVEAAQIDAPITLAPGGHWQAWQRLSVEPPAQWVARPVE